MVEAEKHDFWSEEAKVAEAARHDLCTKLYTIYSLKDHANFQQFDRTSKIDDFPLSGFRPRTVCQ